MLQLEILKQTGGVSEAIWNGELLLQFAEMLKLGYATPGESKRSFDMMLKLGVVLELVRLLVD